MSRIKLGTPCNFDRREEGSKIRLMATYHPGMSVWTPLSSLGSSIVGTRPRQICKHTPEHFSIPSRVYFCRFEHTRKTGLSKAFFSLSQISFEYCNFLKISQWHEFEILRDNEVSNGVFKIPHFKCVVLSCHLVRSCSGVYC